MAYNPYDSRQHQICDIRSPVNYGTGKLPDNSSNTREIEERRKSPHPFGLAREVITVSVRASCRLLEPRAGAAPGRPSADQQAIDIMNLIGTSMAEWNGQPSSASVLKMITRSHGIYTGRPTPYVTIAYRLTDQDGHDVRKDAYRQGATLRDGTYTIDVHVGNDEELIVMAISELLELRADLHNEVLETYKRRQDQWRDGSAELAINGQAGDLND